MLPVVWLAEAVAELHDAVNWYSAVRPELGLRFARAVDETVKAVAKDPMLFSIVDKQQRRRAGVPRFPYGLFFLVEKSQVVVFACFHGKRNPRRWKLR